MKSIEIVERRAHHAEVEVAGHRQVRRQLGTLEVGDPGRRDTHGDQPVVEMRRHAVAEVGRHDLMQRLGDQQQRERHADHHQRPDQRRIAA